MSTYFAFHKDRIVLLHLLIFLGHYKSSKTDRHLEFVGPLLSLCLIEVDCDNFVFDIFCKPNYFEHMKSKQLSLK